jgi:hypothetical protein
MRLHHLAPHPNAGNKINTTTISINTDFFSFLQDVEINRMEDYDCPDDDIEMEFIPMSGRRPCTLSVAICITYER